MNDTGGEPYEKGGELSPETKDDLGKYHEKSTKGDDFKSAVADALSKTPVSKLFLILSMLVYAIISYSKREQGVKAEDLANFIFFSLFSVFIFIFLALSSHIYRRYLKFFILGEPNFGILDLGKKLNNFFVKKYFSILILLIILFVFLFFKANIINLLNSFIGSFNNR